MGSLFNFIAFECFLIVILGYYYYYICLKQILELHIERYVKSDLIFHNSITFSYFSLFSTIFIRNGRYLNKIL